MSPLELFDEIISFEVSCVVFGSEIRWTGQHLVGLISQFHNQKWKILVGHWTIQLGIQWLAAMAGFHTHTTALCTMEQSSNSVCQVWMSSGLPECFTFSYCEWLWNWLNTMSWTGVFDGSLPDLDSCRSNLAHWLWRHTVALLSLHCALHVWLSSLSPSVSTLLQVVHLGPYTSFPTWSAPQNRACHLIL